MPVRILLVEDNAYLAPPLIRLLKRAGYEVTHVDCCAKARAVDGHFDLGVLDLELPDGGGIELSEELVRARHLGAVLFFTGTLDGALLRQAERLAPCVRKTDGTEALLAAIRGALADATRASRV
jgi:DNA-binding response OmpR family regulator